MVKCHYIPQLLLRHFCKDNKIQYYNLETKIDIQTKRSACINETLKARRIFNNEKLPSFLKLYFDFGAKACEDRFSGNDIEWFCKMLNKDFETVCPKGNQYIDCYFLKDLLKNNPIAFWEAYHKVL
jgi:hypothetical protein